MTVFWNATERRLRTVWRLAAQTVLMIGLGILPILIVAEPLTALHRRGLFLPTLTHDNYDRVVNMMVGPLLAAAVLGSMAIAARWLDHRPWSEFRGQLDRAGWIGLGTGFAVGAIVTGLVFAVEWMAGWVTVSGLAQANVVGVPLALGFGFSAVKVLCVGTYEEFLSRGYHLRNLADGLGLPGAVVGSSAIFALLHLTNENAGALSTLGLFVNALFFASALLATGRLSTAIGAHIGWNLFQGAVLGFPVSGDKEPASLIGLEQGGPALWTGGAFGPEAGMLGIIASCLGIALMLGVTALAERRTPRWDPAAASPSPSRLPP
jgi:membrane protease YdiL (CAAX protease family)